MTSDLLYDWSYARPKRWRRWVARLAAVLALAACAVGIWMIVRAAVRHEPATPVTLVPELRRLAGGQEALATRLEALRPHHSRALALAALKETSADQAAAVAALQRARAAGPVRAAGQLDDALTAEGTYLAAVGRVLQHPRSRVAKRLGTQAKRARAAFAALPDAGGVPATIRGWRRLAAYARASRG